jgi:DNA-binding GntR family transcriptional regulator
MAIAEPRALEELRMSRPPSLTDSAIEHLANAIISGRFQPGQRLVETELSATLGISRAPLREALRVLANDGLVEIRQSKGSYVAQPSAEDLERAVVFRALIEGTAARFVAHNRDPVVLAKLGRALQAMREAHHREDNDEFIARLWEFHREICLASDNPLLIQSWNLASNITRLYQHIVVGVSIPRATVLKNNASILEALCSAEPSEAENQVRSCIIFLVYQLLDRPIPGAIKGYVTHAPSSPGKPKSRRRP